jgi:hypothetical protein
MEELEPWEMEIIARFRAAGFVGASPKAEWIRGYLRERGRGYPYEMWKRWARFARAAGCRPGTYLSFVRFLWVLRRLGLVREAGEEPTGRGFPRRYYELVPGMEGSGLWSNPVKALYRHLYGG